MKLHLIAIGGTGMGSLAGLLAAAGHEVRGSDEALYPPMSDQLRQLGVPVYEGFRAGNLDWGPDRVVVGNVCRRDHVEVLAAQERGLALTSFPAVLEELFLASRHSVVVAGTHGKTTTSSLLAHILVEADCDPGFLIGGVPHNFGRGWRLGEGPHFVVEGDEYDTAFFDKGSKFLHYRPRTAILTSIELDHVDIFDSLDAVRAAFVRFVELLPAEGTLVVAASSGEALNVARHARCRVERYAVGERGGGVPPFWHGTLVPGRAPGRARLEVTRGGEPFGTFEVPLAGEHNAENALAAIAAATALGLAAGEIAAALPRFAGVKRRQEVRGRAAGIEVIDDYAHHPTAIRETLAALRARAAGGRLLAVFEPRSATSRRATFQAQFADALASADEVVVARPFKLEGIPAGQRLDAERLAADVRVRGTAARMIPEVDGIVDHVVDRVQPGDVIVVFSSGGFGDVHDKLLRRLGDPILPARPGDMPRVREMLAHTGQPHADLTDERCCDVSVVVDENGIAGCVALEVMGGAGILRSLAVIPERRGCGLGWMLADHAVRRAREAGVEELYLLTESASDFFAEKLGFRAVDRRDVDAETALSRHFRDIGAGTVAMRLDL